MNAANDTRQALDNLEATGSVTPEHASRCRAILDRVEQDFARERAQQKKQPASDSTPPSQPLAGDSEAAQTDSLPTQPDLSPAQTDSPAAPSDSQPAQPSRPERPPRHFNFPVVPCTLGAPVDDISLDIQNHHRDSKRSPLDKLPPEDQQAIFEMLDTYSSRVLAPRLARPRPDGFGISTSYASLNRFRRRYTEAIELREQEQADRQAREILLQNGSNEPAFAAASEHLLKKRLYQLTLNPASTPRDIAQLFRVQRDLRRQTLAERKQSHLESLKK